MQQKLLKKKNKNGNQTVASKKALYKKAWDNEFKRKVRQKCFALQHENKRRTEGLLHNQSYANNKKLAMKWKVEVFLLKYSGK